MESVEKHHIKGKGANECREWRSQSMEGVEVADISVSKAHDIDMSVMLK